jgi:hypothetical protein
MSESGQNAKNSERANDFRFAPNIRHCSAAQFSGENHLRLNSSPVWSPGGYPKSTICKDWISGFPRDFNRLSVRRYPRGRIDLARPDRLVQPRCVGSRDVKPLLDEAWPLIEERYRAIQANRPPTLPPLPRSPKSVVDARRRRNSTWPFRGTAPAFTDRRAVLAPARHDRSLPATSRRVRTGRQRD